MMAIIMTCFVCQEKALKPMNKWFNVSLLFIVFIEQGFCELYQMWQSVLSLSSMQFELVDRIVSLIVCIELSPNQCSAW